MTDETRALQVAVTAAPDNAMLRSMLARALAQDGEHEGAAREFIALHQHDKLTNVDVELAIRSSIEAGLLIEASDLLEQLRIQLPDSSLDALEVQLRAALLEPTEPVHDRQDADDVGASAALDADLPSRLHPLLRDGIVEREHSISFDAVGGLNDVKRSVRRMIVLPYEQPELYETYGRTAGGGVLLFGPPGCGKTMLARAVAGECGDLPFINLRVDNLLNPHFGESERALHEAFEFARSMAPCVLFIDELDAIAYSRTKRVGEMGRTLVNQLLIELDSIGNQNEGLLVLAATNAPWDVDDALKRPGRFDRSVFVPPPDAEARASILRSLLRNRPTERLDERRIARGTQLYSGADLRAVVDRALDAAIEAALDAGEVVPVQQAHLDQAMREQGPSTVDWLVASRNYVDFANDGGRYDDVAKFLKTKEAKSLR